MVSKLILFFISVFAIACSSMQGLDPELLSHHYRPRRSVFFFSENPSKGQETIDACLNGIARNCVDVAAKMIQDENENGAYKFFEIACNLDYGKGCYGAGRIKLDQANRTTANDFFEKGCKYKFGPSCFALAELKYEVKGKHQDELNLYGLACDMNGDYGCVRLGEIFYADGNLGLAQYYFHRSCSLKNELGCYNAGQSYYEQKNLSKAVEMLRLSCKYGQAEGCYQLARHYGYLKQDEKVFFYLNEAFKNDYQNWERVEFDKNFAWLRKRMAFRDLVDRFLLQKREKKVQENTYHDFEQVKLQEHLAH